MASQQVGVGRDEIQMKRDLDNQEQPDYHRQMDQLSDSTQSNSILQQAADAASGAARGAVNATHGAASGAVNLASGAASGAVNLASGAASGAANLASEAASGAANIASGATEAVKNTLGINNPDNTAYNAIPPTSSANHPSNPHPANPNTKI